LTVSGCKEVIKPTSKTVNTTVGNKLNVTSSSSSAAAAAAVVDCKPQLIPLPGPNIETGSTIDKTLSATVPQPVPVSCLSWLVNLCFFYKLSLAVQ